jgi:hypothetical protein
MAKSNGLNQMKHYRTLSLDTPFTLEALETYCAALRAQQCLGDTAINCTYAVTLRVQIQEPIL